MSVGAEVAGYAHAAGVGQDRKALPEFTVEVVPPDFVHYDGIRLLQDTQLVVGDFADDANCEAGTGEGLPINDLFRQAKLQAHTAHLVLEQVAQRLDKAEFHVLRQSADIVMGLNFCGHGVIGRLALDDIRIERTLREEVNGADAGGFLVEDANELFADNFALLLGVYDAPERAEEVLGGIGVHQVRIEVALECVANSLRLALAHHSVVHENAGETVADGALDERRSHSGIDTAGQGADDLAAADLLAHALNAVTDEVPRRPKRGAAANFVEEVLDNRLALRRMNDLRVELQPQHTRAVAHYDDGRVFGAGEGPEAGRRLANLVAVAHPHGHGLRKVLEDWVIACASLHDGVTVLFARSRSHRAAELVRHSLHTVADAEHGQSGVVHPGRRERGIGLIDAGGTA